MTYMSTFITIIIILAVIFLIPQIRRILITFTILKIYKKVLPKFSSSEQEALEAGDLWWEQEFFKGTPKWENLHNIHAFQLTQEEQDFMKDSVDTLCSMVSEWDIAPRLEHLPTKVMDHLKKHRFFGLIIPKQYGGHGFSAYAHSEMIAKLSSHSSLLTVTTMVPNSLGPGELILYYGTQKQKDYYLPRLANGDEIPAFALTGPWSGSDAGNMPDVGIICKKMINGKEEVGFSLTFHKRYITLAPICTLFGLAFKAQDPNGILGNKKDLGITCALIPANTEGVDLSRRHLPMFNAFMNGPIMGKDVFIPISAVIGEQEGVGMGWKMLMECLSIGRSISLPSTGAGIAQLVSKTVGAYTTIRRQFKVPIIQLEGIKEALAPIGGYTYAIDSVRQFTAAGVYSGQHPSIASAMAKYYCTENARKIVIAGMDILGGKGIMIGPSNFLASAYETMPIIITVEGANILSRSMIIYGQGVMRAHPYIFRELKAIKNDNNLKEFDNVFWKHVLSFFGHFIRLIWYRLGLWRLIKSPINITKPISQYYKLSTWFATLFAVITEILMLSLGGSLKFRERTTGRMADSLMGLYAVSAMLWRYKNDGSKKEDIPLIEWAMKTNLADVEHAIKEVLRNYPKPLLGKFLSALFYIFIPHIKKPSDKLENEVAMLLSTPNDSRKRLTAQVVTGKSEVLSAIEQALELTKSIEAIERKMHLAEKSGAFVNKVYTIATRTEMAYKLNIITEVEFEKLKEFKHWHDIVIHVDDFTVDNPLNNETLSGKRNPL